MSIISTALRISQDTDTSWDLAISSRVLSCWGSSTTERMTPLRFWRGIVILYREYEVLSKSKHFARPVHISFMEHKSKGLLVAVGNDIVDVVGSAGIVVGKPVNKEVNTIWDIFQGEDDSVREIGPCVYGVCFSDVLKSEGREAVKEKKDVLIFCFVHACAGVAQALVYPLRCVLTDDNAFGGEVPGSKEFVKKFACLFHCCLFLLLDIQGSVE